MRVHTFLLICAFVIHPPHPLPVRGGEGGSAGDVGAISPSLFDAVPPDLVAAYFVAGPDRTEPPGDVRSAVAWAAFLADLAAKAGFLAELDEDIRMWIDALAAASVVLESAAGGHAVVLFDINATARADGGHELAGLHAALIANTGGANQTIERRIQHLLNTYTNSKDTVLSLERDSNLTPESGHVIFTIRDRRLPSWAAITWGQLGDHYVVAVGDGAFARVAGTIASSRVGDAHPTSLAADGWFTEALAQANADRASVAWHIRFDTLRRNAAAADTQSVGWHAQAEGAGMSTSALSLAEKIERVQAALGLANTERGLWTVGYNGSSLEAVGVLRRNGRDEIVPIAGTRFLDTLDESVIPNQATGYAVIGWNPRTVLPSVCEAYLAAKSPRAQRRSRAFWQELQKSAGVSIERDIFAHLSGPVVIHNYPRHALKLPFAWTILVPINRDSATLARAVPTYVGIRERSPRSHIDRLLETARRQLIEARARKGVRLQLRHDPDGIWYIQFGLTGPALAITRQPAGWLIVSFSPQAVRQNLALLSRKPHAVRSKPPP